MTHTHNYIPYNCDIILIQEVHALTYPFPHKSSHSFHQFQAPNTWMFLVHFTQTQDCFTVPKQRKWAVHGQPTPPTSVPLGGTEFPWSFPTSYTQNTIYRINHNSTTHTVHTQSVDCLMAKKNSNNSVPSFGIDQTAVQGLNPTKTS